MPSPKSLGRRTRVAAPPVRATPATASKKVAAAKVASKKKTAAPAKRGRGRPPFVPGQPGQRYQVHLLPSVAERLREFGDGSLSAGIHKAAQALKLG